MTEEVDSEEWNYLELQEPQDYSLTSPEGARRITMKEIVSRDTLKRLRSEPAWKRTIIYPFKDFKLFGKVDLQVEIGGATNPFLEYMQNSLYYASGEVFKDVRITSIHELSEWLKGRLEVCLNHHDETISWEVFGTRGLAMAKAINTAEVPPLTVGDTVQFLYDDYGWKTVRRGMIAATEASYIRVLTPSGYRNFRRDKIVGLVHRAEGTANSTVRDRILRISVRERMFTGAKVVLTAHDA